MKSLKKAVFMVLTTLFLMSAVPAMADNITMYAPDGRTATVAEGDVQSWQSVGWYTYPVMNIYSVYNSFPIAKSDLAYWQEQGWYAYPVMNVYSADGSVIPIAQSDLADWQNKGWYTYPVMNVYSADGSVVPIAQSDLADWQNKGWYTYPVMNVYASNGQVCVIAKSDLADWEKMGWYAAAENNGYNNNNTNSQYNQNTNYSSAYYKLASQIMTKGTKSKSSSGRYVITYSFENGTMIGMSYNMGEEDYIALTQISYTKSNSEVATTLFLYKDEIPSVVNLLTLNDGTEFDFIGEYRTPQITVIESDVPETNDSIIQLLKSTYELFDTFMMTRGIDVKISDFGIAY